MATKAKVVTEYVWKPGARFPVPAAVAGPAIEAIQRRCGGGATPADVVEAARDPGHPLHPCFVWDDDAAAERWREHQARGLLNSVRVVVRHQRGEPVRQVAFVSVCREGEGRAYLPAAVVIGDDELRARALADALAALRGWKARYGHLKELAGVVEAIERAAA